MNFDIQIISDVVCPWCFVGKRRLESAMEALNSDNFTLKLRPFQLNPDIQEDSVKLQDYLVAKFGNIEQVTEAQDRLEAVAMQEGIKMDFSKIEYAHNTLKAHALMQSVGTQEEKLQLNEALMAAYFEQGQNIGSPETLEKIAQEINVSYDTSFNEPNKIEAVKQEELRVKQIGVNAVPSFIINGKYLIQGAQPMEQFIQVFEQIRKEQ